MSFETFRLNFWLIYLIPNLILYAIYVVCFAFAFHLIRIRKSSEFQWNLVLLGILFAFVTAFVGVNAFFTLCIALHDRDLVQRPDSQGTPICKESLIHGSSVEKGLAYGAYTFLVLCQCIADFIILRRCYLVWAQRKAVIILPALILVASFALGVTTISLEANLRADDSTGGRPASTYAYSIITLVMNLLVTGLTAGRIYYLARAGGMYLDDAWRRRYKTIVAMILESGMIYSITLFMFLLSIVLSDNPSVNKSDAGRQFAQVAKYVLLPVVVQASGIAPTVLLLRANLIESSTNVPSEEVRLTARPRFGHRTSVESPLSSPSDSPQDKKDTSMYPDRWRSV